MVEKYSHAATDHGPGVDRRRGKELLMGSGRPARDISNSYDMCRSSEALRRRGSGFCLEFRTSHKFRVVYRELRFGNDSRPGLPPTCQRSRKGL